MWNIKTKKLEDNIGESLEDLGLNNAFLDTTPKAESTKERIGKSDFLKI